MKIKEQYQIKNSNWYAALENSPSEHIIGNTKIIRWKEASLTAELSQMNGSNLEWLHAPSINTWWSSWSNIEIFCLPLTSYFLMYCRRLHQFSCYVPLTILRNVGSRTLFYPFLHKSSKYPTLFWLSIWQLHLLQLCSTCNYDITIGHPQVFLAISCMHFIANAHYYYY